MALVQTKTKPSVGSVSSLAATWTSNTVTGNTIIVGFVLDASTRAGDSSIADSQGNTYARILFKAGTFHFIELWYAKNITGGTTPTVTLTFDSSAAPTDGVMIIREYSGLDTTAPLDVSTSGTGTSAAPSSGATATTAQASELVVGLAATVSGNNSYVLGSGYGNLANDVSGSSSDLGMEDQTVSSTGAQTATFSITSANWTCAVATFKTAAASTHNYGFNTNRLRPHPFSPGLAR